jgi:hypothetical protein
VREHGRTIVLEMLSEQDPRRCLGHNRGQRRLAGHQRLAAQVVAVQLNQVERAEDDSVVVVMVSKALEIRDAGVVASDRLAVDNDRART